METQVFLGEKPCEDKLEPVENSDFLNKPEGGLWTSTLTNDNESAWVKWCRRERWWNTESRELWALEVGDADIYEIDTVADLGAIIEVFQADTPLSMPQLDFEALAEVYDGIHLTANGQAVTRFIPEANLYGWDCESTLFFDWVFTDVWKLGQVDPDR